MLNDGVLAESPHYVLTHEYETVTLVCRITGERTVIADHYGDPACGLIAPDESWFATAGEGVSVFTLSGGTRSYLRDRHLTYHVAAMKLDGPEKCVFWSIHGQILHWFGY